MQIAWSASLGTRVPVGGRVDRDGLDAQLPAGADDPQGDLPAVGDEDLESIGQVVSSQ